ncbi:MAG TPA: Minf_1886 family protein [Chthoniobacterales bacterium]|nr:Minf_1886 family protein [Chthoniobacterales bacterium]
MQRSFNEVVDQIIEKDPRYGKEAYIFLKEALEFTIKQRKRGKGEPGAHVNASELLEGFRQLALKEFGPMVMTVFEYWGVLSSSDVGQMVFNLIGAGVFGKTDSDSVEDFDRALDFHLAFVAPFEPRSSNRANS